MSKITQIIKEARDQGRLTALDFAQGIFDDFIELHGDRNFRDDGAVIGGVGRLGDQTVTVVGIQKGKNLQASGEIWPSSCDLYQYSGCLSWCWC